MEVILGKTAGFCPGVRNAVVKAQKVVEDNKETYCLGELIHNPIVVGKLAENGMKVVKNITEVPKGANLIIRAHGIPKQTYEEIQEKEIKLIDLTCPKVLKIHEQVEEYANKGYYIILIGEKNHPETIGTLSFCGENSSVVETIEDIDITVSNLNKTDIRNITIFSQTTFNIEKFEKLKELIKNKIPKDSNLEINKTICDATRLRQTETREIAKQVELMIIIGGKKSSNTNKLYDISKEVCNNAMFVENMEDLYLNYIRRFKKVGVMAGASTPQDMIDEIVKILESTETKGYMYENSRL